MGDLVAALLTLGMLAPGGAAPAAAEDRPVIRAFRLEAASPAVAPTPKEEVVLLSEGFEDSWPASPWRVTHPDGAAEVDWGRTDHRAAAGSFSIRCAGSGPDAPPPGDPAPPGTTSWAIAGPFDLSEATSGSLRFELWLETERVHDLFMWLASTDGRVFDGSATSTGTDGGWRTVSADLADWGDAGSVLGAGSVWIAFVYVSDHNDDFEGAYVDGVTLTVDVGGPAGDGITYTTTDDFETGTMLGLEAADGSMRLVESWSAPPYLWVPTTSLGVVSRIDVADGSELGRYRTGPDRALEPSAVAVDLDGSCWVGNQAAGTVVKIGLEERGDCVDRDSDGVVDTSRDDDGDGAITGDELLPWGADECVLYEVVLVDGARAVHVPGDGHGDYLANGVGALAVDADNGVWVGVRADRLVHRLDGDSGAVLETVDLSNEELEPNAAVVDGGGRVWIAGWPSTELLRLDTAGGVDLFFQLGHAGRSVAVDGGGGLLAAEGDGGLVSRLATETGDPEWTVDAGVDAEGVKATEDGDIWVAVPGGGVVRRFTPGGFVRATIPIGGAPREIAIDAAGKVWTLGPASSVIERLDPATNRNDLDLQLAGADGHDVVGDLTGVVSRSLTTRIGSWRVVFDAIEAGTPWGTVSWTGTTPAGAATRVRVRSSEDATGWSSWEDAASGVGLRSTPAGRYLQVEVILQLVSGQDPPQLDELTIAPGAAVDPPVASFSWSPSVPVAGQPVQLTDGSTGGPASWSWDFGDGDASTDRNPVHSWAVAGTYTVGLTVANDGGSDTATADLTVAPAGTCLLTCQATVPATGTAGEPVAFDATTTAAGCSGAATVAWSFGDGAVATDASVAHAYGAAGRWEWRLEASADGATCSRSGWIRIEGVADGCDRPQWIPVASHAAGSGGTVWRTDVGLLGVAGGAGTAELRLHAADGVTTREVTVTASEMVDLADVVGWLRPGEDLSAALEVCSDGPLVVTSRTFNQLSGDDPCLAGGTFGQRLDGAEPSAGLAAGQVAVLPHLREDDQFRTNLGFTNAGIAAATVRVTLRDAAGDRLAAYDVDLGPGRWRQDNRPFATRGGTGDLAAGSVRLEVTAGAGVLVYASLVDNLTGDASTVVPRVLDDGQ